MVSIPINKDIQRRIEEGDTEGTKLGKVESASLILIFLPPTMVDG